MGFLFVVDCPFPPLVTMVLRLFECRFMKSGNDCARTIVFRPGKSGSSPQVTTRVLSPMGKTARSEEHTSELQSLTNLVCRLLLVPSITEMYTLSLPTLFRSHGLFVRRGLPVSAFGDNGLALV